MVFFYFFYFLLCLLILAVRFIDLETLHSGIIETHGNVPVSECFGALCHGFVSVSTLYIILLSLLQAI